MPVIAHIEDEPLDHVALKCSLSQHYKLLYFNDLYKFIEVAPVCDLIITDLRLPQTYGYETIEEIRRYYPEHPLLVLTGMGGAYLTGDLIRNLIECGATNVVSKDLLGDPHLTRLIESLIK